MKKTISQIVSERILILDGAMGTMIQQYNLKEEDLKDIFGTKVNLVEKGKRGKIEIEYYSRDELERLIEIMRSLK